MENLILTANIVLPIFLVMVVGYVCRQAGIVTETGERAVNRLVFSVFLPASLAESLMTADTGMGINYAALLVCLAGVFATFLAGMAVVPRIVTENARRSVLIQGMYRSNYAIFGIPLAEALFPQGDGGVAAMMVLATIPLFNVLAVFTFEFFRGERCDLRKILIGILKNPLIWGCAIGYVFMRLPIALPEFAMSTLSKLTDISSPLALFALGASLDLRKLRGNLRALICGVSARLILIPAVLLSIVYCLGFRGPEFAALMIAFASPCAVSSYTMAVQMGGDGDLAGQLVMLSTVLSSLTIFALVFMCKTWGIF